MFRQTCADKIGFNADGTIKAITPTNTGVGALAALTIVDSNVARGKNVAASSYKDTTYSAKRITDENFTTLWKAANKLYPQTLTIDLGKSRAIARVETFFEYPTESYQYSIHTSTDSSTWQLYADRSANAIKVNPMIDSATTTTRYVRITILGTSHSSYFPSGDTIGLVAGIWDVKVRKNSSVGICWLHRNSIAAHTMRVSRLAASKGFTITFADADAARRVFVCNIDGRAVCSFPAVNAVVTWNGLGSLGASLQSGMYILRATGAKFGSCSKVFVY
jgi:hypothetical protein